MASIVIIMFLELFNFCLYTLYFTIKSLVYAICCQGLFTCEKVDSNNLIWHAAGKITVVLY